MRTLGDAHGKTSSDHELADDGNVPMLGEGQEAQGEEREREREREREKEREKEKERQFFFWCLSDDFGMMQAGTCRCVANVLLMCC